MALLTFDKDESNEMKRLSSRYLVEQCLKSHEAFETVANPRVLLDMIKEVSFNRRVC